MSEAAMLHAALREVIDKCNGEMNERLSMGKLPPDANVREHLKVAEEALQRLVQTAGDDECTAIAREVLGAVARFRRCLDGDQSPVRDHG